MFSAQQGQESDLFQLLGAEVLLGSNIPQMFGMGYTTEHKSLCLWIKHCTDWTILPNLIKSKVVKTFYIFKTAEAPSKTYIKF